MRIYRGILSLGINLHAYLPWYPFPGDYFACVFTVVSFPWGLFCMRIYSGILSLGINLHTYLLWYRGINSLEDVSEQSEIRCRGVRVSKTYLRVTFVRMYHTWES